MSTLLWNIKTTTLTVKMLDSFSLYCPDDPFAIQIDLFVSPRVPGYLVTWNLCFFFPPFFLVGWQSSYPSRKITNLCFLCKSVIVVVISVWIHYDLFIVMEETIQNKYLIMFSFKKPASFLTQELQIDMCISEKSSLFSNIRIKPFKSLWR